MSRNVWVSLAEVVQLALYGEPTSLHPNDESKRDAKPGLLRGLEGPEQCKRREQFDIALSKAGLDGKVHFQGIRSSSAVPEPVPLTYFVVSRGFNYDGSILPWAFDPLAYRHREPIQHGITWKQAAANCSEFCNWFLSEYPQNAGCLRGIMASIEPKIPSKARRQRPSLERAKKAIGELWPDQVPDQVKLNNEELFQKVGDHLKNHNVPSKTTILRAAGRRSVK